MKITLHAHLLFLILCHLFFMNSFVFASTDIGGPIYTDTLWEKGSSPYVITTTLKIHNGATLTIDPGVEILFEEGSEFIVEGGIIAKGAPNNPVLISSKNQYLKWGTITFNKNADGASYTDDGVYIEGSIFEYVIIDSIYGIEFEGSSAYLNNVIYRNSNNLKYKHVSSKSHIHESYFDSNTTSRNNSGNNGGAIFFYSSKSLSLKNCTFDNNSASGNGGAIYHSNSSLLSLNNCTFKNNSAAEGGAISSHSKTYPDYSSNSPTSNELFLKSVGCIFTDNMTSGNGGAFAIQNHPDIPFLITGSTFSNNSGGGLVISSSQSPKIMSTGFTSKIVGCTFENNTGNGINFDGGKVKSLNCVFNDNSSSAISVGGLSTLKFVGCSFIENENSIFQSSNSDSSMTFIDCNFLKNKGVFIVNAYLHQIYSLQLQISLDLTFTGCSFVENSSETIAISSWGAAIISYGYDKKIISPIYTLSSDSFLKITNCLFFQNIGVLVHSGQNKLYMENNLIYNNIGNYIVLGRGEIVNCTFENNEPTNISTGISYPKSVIIGSFNLQGNNFTNNSGYEYVIRNGASSADAQNNYWGTSDENIINSLIFDLYDEKSKGEVIYYPFLIENNSKAPSATDTYKDSEGVPTVKSITIDPDLSFYLPSALYKSQYGDTELWAYFQFFNEQNGQMLWQLSDFGIPTTSSSYSISIAPDMSFSLTDAIATYDAGSPIVQVVLQADFQYFGEQNGALLWYLADIKVENISPQLLSTCGAFVAPGVWKEFDCYNLAAIGKTTDDNPLIPSWRLIGGYWQWGRKGPSSSQWHNTNTEHFAHGPTGPGSSEANEEEISGWDTTGAPDGAWSDTTKTADDPCPDGFRVPTRTQWQGVLYNNTQSTVGTWSGDIYDHTNYSAARSFGSKLMLPAAGDRYSHGIGRLHRRGYSGRYWSSSELGSGYASNLYFLSGSARSKNDYRWSGHSVRCVAE